jgi:ethanolaminephosphotransferase
MTWGLGIGVAFVHNRDKSGLTTFFSSPASRCDQSRKLAAALRKSFAIMVYVRQEKLPSLKEYKYSGIDHSLLSRYVLKPFYTNFVIECFPMWMAPNLITLSGFSFIILNILTLLWYTPTLDQDCPRWVYFSWAIGLFLYQTFDAVDGSQAYVTNLRSSPYLLIISQAENSPERASRRAVRSWCGCAQHVARSPCFRSLTELWHGMENCSHAFRMYVAIYLCEASANNIAALLTFYVQTWDEYHTKTLTLGIVSGPVEGIVILTLVYAFTGIMGGGSFWQQSMLRTVGIPQFAFIPDLIYDMPFTEWWMVQGGAVLVLNTIQSLVFQNCVGFQALIVTVPSMSSKPVERVETSLVALY